MLDIIIPVYNDIHNLAKTLISLISIQYPFEVIIIDDCSTNLNNFNEIIKLFENQFQIKVYKLEKNSGPGVARQVGLNKSKANFVWFIDCGDIVINGDQIQQYLLKAENDKDIMVISFQMCTEHSSNNFYFENKDVSDQYLKNKIIKKDFIQQYDIKFDENCSYYYEDASFNLLILLYLWNYNFKNLYIDIPVMVYTWDDNSAVHIDNSKKFFKQSKCQAQAYLFAIKEAQAHNVSNIILENMSCQNFANIYYAYLNIKSVCPEALQYSIEALKLFYNTTKSMGFNLSILINKYPQNIKEKQIFSDILLALEDGTL